MGRLTPGTTYIYERVDGVVYAREAGSDVSTRFEIGRDYNSMAKRGNDLIDQARQNKLWVEIFQAAKTNFTLQAALDECIMIYKLSKEYKDDNV